jgi:hypothetical protein
MPASMLTEDRVSAHRINSRNMIEKNLVECLQIYKVTAETEMIIPQFLSFYAMNF